MRAAKETLIVNFDIVNPLPKSNGGRGRVYYYQVVGDGMKQSLI